MPPMDIEAFLGRWSAAPSSERANSQPFLLELCSLLGVDKPHTGNAGAYCFERTVKRFHPDGSTRSDGRIDLYKEGCFVLESKQKTEKERTNDKAFSLGMIQAKQQAEEYAKFLPEWPPFLVVVDVGHAIELFVDFSGTGKRYHPFIQQKAFQGHRLQLNQLRDDGVRALLKRIWTDPWSLDPSIVSQAVTTRVASHLADISRSLEKQNHDPEQVSSFLMRCIFTMFAEDVRLLPPKSFTKKLEHWVQHPQKFAGQLQKLWQEMDAGGESLAFEEKILRFNGGLFKDTTTFQLNHEQVERLLDAAKQDWTEVEPAIFGTLLERALNPRERHKLGAHFTPRAYVERLVYPTVIEPLREDWDRVKVAVVARLSRLDTLKSDKARADARAAARKELLDFHHSLCTTRVLDPACGTGNFLYVAMEHMKRLEAEVLDLLAQIEGTHRLALLSSSSEAHRETVDPHQFLGIELNARAAVIAEMVLWIGYLQWHYRTLLASSGTATVGWHEPVLRQFNNIEHRDAVLAWDGAPELVVDESGLPVTRWDGVSTKRNPVTGEDVPDETKLVQLWRYNDPQIAPWPSADFIVGNPPFLGTKRMRAVLGDGYVEALRQAYAGDLQDNADYVMFWWQRAADAVTSKKARAFGLITTNSITQSFSRRVVTAAMERGLRLRFAIPDHPWVDAESGAAVRIAMTSGDMVDGSGTLVSLLSEGSSDAPIALEFCRRTGLIHPDLTIGVNLPSAKALKANEAVCGMGVALHGAGFILEPVEAAKIRASGPLVIKPYLGGKDLVQVRRERYVIDLSFMTLDEARDANPAALQHVIDHVKPERDQNRREAIRVKWWRYGWERPGVRSALQGLQRYIGTTETSKHRVFQFIDAAVLPDHMIVVVATDEPAHLAVLSSRAHVTFMLATGGRLGVGNDPRYTKTRCFDPFPFPTCTSTHLLQLRALGEALDLHRKSRQVAHPDLTITGMYNVVDKLRSGEAFSDREKVTHEQGLCSILKQLHDDIDAAVFDAYGWPRNITDEETLERLVALNHERAAEERRGLVRWLRPEYQVPLLQQPAQAPVAADDDPIDDEADEPETKPTKKAAKAKAMPWPEGWPARVGAIDDVLRADGGTTVDSLSSRFTKASKADVKDLLDALCGFGRAEQVEPGVYMAVG